MNTNIDTLAAIMAAAVLLVPGAPARASDDDSRIESSAKNSYVFKTYLKDDSVKVNAKDGVVTLTGSVLENTHKSLAQETVAGLPGVKKVENQLVVKNTASPERSDAWLTTKVKSTLLFHRNVSAAKTEVTVKDGVVTLTGEAENAAQKELTAEYARDVEGVKVINNALTVAKKPGAPPTLGEKIDDASITAQVKISLATHHSTSALKTGVETIDGIVYASGVAKSAAEKALVTKLVTDIKGVKNVVNVMVVEASVTSK